MLPLVSLLLGFEILLSLRELATKFFISFEQGGS